MFLMNIDTSIFTKVVGHEYFLAFYGVIVYYAIIYKIWKHTNKNGTWKAFRKYAASGFLSTIAVAFTIIILDDETVYLINMFTGKTFQFGDWVYMSSGPLLDGLVRIIIKLRS